MEWPSLGVLVIIAFGLLILAIVINSCWKPVEGFTTKQSLPTQPEPIAKPQEVTGSELRDLPSAPVDNLADVNSLPYQDPALEKATTQMLTSLKADMDGFIAFEVPNLSSKNDPSITLPLTQLKGDHQRVKDELLVLEKNPGLQSQLTVEDVDGMGANLRYLQRTYRSYAAAQLVPAPKSFSEKSSAVEGFTSKTPIKPDELNTLSLKLTVEIARLNASGSTDPIIKARTNVFRNMLQTVNDLNTRVKNGSLAAADIPIMETDYAKFLPALGNNSSGISGLVSRSGSSTLSSLFNSYDAGDISGSKLAAALFDKYADDLFKGLSYNISFTSVNDVAKQQAIAAQKTGGILHPGSRGARGEFDSTIRDLADGFESGLGPRPVQKTTVGKFDWKARAAAISENIRRAGMNPGDYGCMEKDVSVSSDFSWRGHTKMVCSRLATNADPAIPEQMGCPPVSWKGWRL